MAYVPPRIGDLRSRVTFQRKTTVLDGRGGYVDGYEDLVSDVAAKVTPRKGNEEVRSQRLSGIEPYEITVRSTEDTRTITTGDRCIDLDTEKVFDVRWVGCLDGRDRFLHLECQTGAPR